MKINVAVTGASGMIGRETYLQLTLDQDIERAIGFSRKLENNDDSHFQLAPDINDIENWEISLKNIDSVVHCAARAHILKETLPDEKVKSQFDTINHKGACTIGEAAIKAGVKNFIFLSSSAVVSRKASKTVAYENMDHTTENYYGESKASAEKSLIKLFKKSDARLIIIRPPLVISANAPGNFGLLKKLATRLPLNPFPSIDNKRNITTLTNLVSAIICCSKLPSGPTEIIHTIEPEPVSTSDLINTIRRSSSKLTFNIPIPKTIVRHLFKISGKTTLYEKTFGNFNLDDSNCKKLIGDYYINNLEGELTKKSP